MRPPTLATASFEKHRKVTRGAAFLAEMDGWYYGGSCALGRTVLSQAGQGAPSGLERMLRVHLPAAFGSTCPVFGRRKRCMSRSRCAGSWEIDLRREPLPDETTILNFRRLLERHELGEVLFQRVNDYLTSRGLKAVGGTIVDASIIVTSAAQHRSIPNRRLDSP
jgi:transposase, IS5 family